MYVQSLSMGSASPLAAPKSRNLPNRILKAFDNAKHIIGLPRGVKDTLAELCRFISQKEPFATIFAHKERIAQRIGASERTVYRHLSKIEEEGLIEVLEQERKSRNGRFAVARIRLTRKAAVMLGFIAADDALTEPDPAAENTVEINVIHRQPNDKMSGGHTLTEPTIAKSQRPAQLKNGLPQDLGWLTASGLSRAGIFKLMGKAKCKGKRLSDIVLACHAYLSPLTGGRLFTYLAKLADGPTDFAVAAANERRRLAERQEQDTMHRKCRMFRERFRNTALTDKAQTTLYLIDERAQYVQVIGPGVQGTQPINDLAPWIKRMETGRLVLATLDVENRILGRA